ncbi:MAG: DnaJ domain-containing protein, partial [Bdellovibrionota bacterium]
MILRSLLFLLLFAPTAFSQMRATRVYSGTHALEILGLKAENASPDKIREAYKSGVKRFHPDAKTAESSAERFNELQEAYDVINGKLAPALPTDTRAGATKENPFYQHDFSQDRPQPKKQYGSDKVPPSDYFVKRFALDIEADGDILLTKEMKARFEVVISKLEFLLRSGKAQEAVAMQFAFEGGSAGAIEKKFARDIFFTLIGEQAHRSKRYADAALKEFLNKVGAAGFPELFSIKRELKLTGGEYGNWPAIYPESLKEILSNPELPKLDYETKRRLILMLLSDDDLKKYKNFYEELAAKNGYVRGQIEKRRIKAMFGTSPEMKEGEFQAQLKILRGNLEKTGPEGDAARHLLMSELLTTKRDLSSLASFVAEIKKIKDFSEFHLVRSVWGNMFEGDPTAVAARKELFGDFLS